MWIRVFILHCFMKPERVGYYEIIILWFRNALKIRTLSRDKLLASGALLTARCALRRI